MMRAECVESKKLHIETITGYLILPSRGSIARRRCALASLALWVAVGLVMMCEI